MTRFNLTARVSIAASAGKRVRRFEMVAYTGVPMKLSGQPLPVIVDMEGIQGIGASRPVLLNHDVAAVVGHTDAMSIRDGKIFAAGPVSGKGSAAKEVLEANDDSFPWQASIGAEMIEKEIVKAGDTAQVNGRRVKGPVIIARSSLLREISFVSLGADGNTSARIAARNNRKVNQMAKHRRAQRSPVTPQVDLQDIEDEATEIEDTDLEAGVDSSADIRAAADESRRRKAIRRACIVPEIRGGRRVDVHHQDIEARAISEGWDIDRVEAEMLPATRTGLDRPMAPFIRSNREQMTAGADIPKLLTASLMIHAGRASLAEKTIGPRATQMAADLRCHSLMDLCAAALRLDQADVPHSKSEMIRAAFSTYSLPIALGTYADKMSADAFAETPSIWQQIARIRPVNNFREHKIVRMLFFGNLEELPNAGQIKMAQIDEDSKTVQAATKAKMLGITRQDVINDDLGLFNDAAASLGKITARTMNDDFVNTILANAGSFFHSSNSNLATGGGSALASATLAARIAAMAKRTDSKGKIIDVRAKTLLVPPELEYTADQLISSAEVMRYVSNSIDNAPTGNPMLKLLTRLTEPRLSSSKYIGYSTTAWYMFGSQQDGAINVALLNGKSTPTIEQAEAPFDQLGVQFRAYMDYGFSLGEPAAADKSNGA